MGPSQSSYPEDVRGAGLFMFDDRDLFPGAELDERLPPLFTSESEMMAIAQTLGLPDGSVSARAYEPAAKRICAQPVNENSLRWRLRHLPDDQFQILGRDIPLINSPDKKGRPPLLQALQRNKSYRVIEQLILHGADPRLGDGTTPPLRHAVLATRSDVGSLLVNAGADASAVGEISRRAALAYNLDFKKNELKRIYSWISADAGHFSEHPTVCFADFLLACICDCRTPVQPIPEGLPQPDLKVVIDSALNFAHKLSAQTTEHSSLKFSKESLKSLIESAEFSLVNATSEQVAKVSGRWKSDCPVFMDAACQGYPAIAFLVGTKILLCEEETYRVFHVNDHHDEIVGRIFNLKYSTKADYDKFWHTELPPLCAPDEVLVLQPRVNEALSPLRFSRNGWGNFEKLVCHFFLFSSPSNTNTWEENVKISHVSFQTWKLLLQINTLELYLLDRLVNPSSRPPPNSELLREAVINCTPPADALPVVHKEWEKVAKLHRELCQ